MATQIDMGDSLPNVVADELRALIVRGTLLPGEHLGQTQLADRFGRSKVPIREALKLLAAEGFLRHDHNRGYFVAPLELEEARQLYKLRRWLEAELLATAVWPTDAQIAEFRRQFDALDAMDQVSDFTNWALALENLRLALFALSPEQILLREATRLWRLTDRYRSLMPRTMGESPERKLIDALAARDRDALLADYMQARAKIEGALEQVFQHGR
ncbi:MULTISPECIES: GntR family transcriptional regulator [unclassified Sphingobium]|uniref:GntR family transcriptional regulator n=1 Tax=unclassified Sphingobium TaxID=2611147 RepID=UPI0022244791|nr:MULTISPECIES: GntR family transcriptional regulator [unclassified Sphingobium]MCW2394057.1 DNA-binding GntR family transcriptional regulator [Sphingobium sp. B8D3B]MCW2417571.1 DNA-binding GntR family transcriptional regulator [Sphingobium sp. B8D3C]